MGEIKVETNSYEETFEFAYKIGEKANSGEIFCLSGDLGVGKTVFSKGFAKGMGIEDHITSPTFGIVNEYYGDSVNKKTLYHFDVYRINSLDEMEDTGYEEYFYGKGVCLIEWAEVVKELIPDNATWITIEKDYNKYDDYRLITIRNSVKEN